MFFGGVNGFTSFFPEQIEDNGYLPPVVLTALSLGGEDPLMGTAADSLTEISLRWPGNFFDFEFAALNYVRPDRNQYAYRLEGFDLEWIETGTRRFGRYTNLPGGTYTLRLKGSNNDGLWNELGTSLKVTVVPPFWRTWWFQAILVLLVIGGAVGTYALRVRSVEARSRDLKVQVADRTRELGALNAVAAVVSRSLDLQKILDDALDVTLRITGTEGGGIYLVDEKIQRLSLVSHRGFSADAVSEIGQPPLDEGFPANVVQSGQPLVVEDVSTDSHLGQMFSWQEGFHSLVCVPLTSRGSVVGTLFATSQDRRVFADQDVHLLTSISQQIGVALQNAQLYKAEQRRAEQFRLISEVGRHIITILELEPLLHEIVRRVSEILGYYLVDIGLIEGDQVVIKTGVGPCWERPDYDPIHFRVGGQSIVGWVAAAGEPLLAPDVRKEPRYYAVPEIPDTQSELAVPMRTTQAVIGVLDVQSRQVDAFDESDVVVLQALADQAAVAIEKAQLLLAERKRADELEALRTTMAELTAELELSALLRAIVERAAGLLGATGGELGLYDEAHQEIQIVVSYNLGQDYVGTRHKLGEGAMGRVAQTRESLILEDYQAWEGGLSAYAHVRATLAAPLMVGTRLVGVFTTVTTDPDRTFNSDDLHLLNLFARQAAIAIENARLYGQARQLAIVQERQRLARDLHDSVSQALYGIRLYSEAAAEELSLGRQDLVVEYLGELQETAQEALAEMRLLIHELRPAVLAEEGLVAALQSRLQAVEGRAGLETEFQVQVEGRLPAELEEELYRIAQEALNNALRHAQASHVLVRLAHSRPEQSIILEIIDNGIGFDPEAVQEKGGIGLSAMRERTLGLGGKLTVTGEAQGGTCVRVEVPL
jgi:signal transduction histidine kinase